MKCSNCQNEMREGFLFTSKDGAFSFANEVPGVLIHSAPTMSKITRSDQAALRELCHAASGNVPPGDGTERLSSGTEKRTIKQDFNPFYGSGLFTRISEVLSDPRP